MGPKFNTSKTAPNYTKIYTDQHILSECYYLGGVNIRPILYEIPIEFCSFLIVFRGVYRRRPNVGYTIKRSLSVTTGNSVKEFGSENMPKSAEKLGRFAVA